MLKILPLWVKKPYFCQVKKNIFIVLLIIPILLQTFDKLGRLVYYQTNKAYITNRFCINKDKPLMMCSGKCYFLSEFEKQEGQKEKIPFNSFQENLTSCFIVERPAWTFTAQFPPKSTIFSIYRICVFFAQSYFTEIFHPPRIH